MAIDWLQVARNLVDTSYREALQREADDAGRDYWVGELMSGRITPTDLQDRMRQVALAPLMYDMQDAEYAAYLRGAAFKESDIEGTFNRTQDRLRSQIERETPVWGVKRQQAEENANNDWESRGLFRSGGRLKDVNDRMTALGLEQQNYEAGITDKIAEAEADRSRQIAASRLNTAEQMLAARRRLSQRDAETAMTNYQVGLG